MADIFDVAISSIIGPQLTSKMVGRIKRYLSRRKRRFLVAPKQIIENIVKELRNRDSILVVDLDNDPQMVLDKILNEKQRKDLESFLSSSPCFYYVLIRKYVKYITYMINEKHISRIIFVTSDVSLFNKTKYSLKKIRYAYPEIFFTSTLDGAQKREIKTFNESIENFKSKLIRFNDIKEFNELYCKYLKK